MRAYISFLKIGDIIRHPKEPKREIMVLGTTAGWIHLIDNKPEPPAHWSERQDEFILRGYELVRETELKYPETILLYTGGEKGILLSQFVVTMAKLVELTPRELISVIGTGTIPQPIRTTCLGDRGVELIILAKKFWQDNDKKKGIFNELTESTQKLLAEIKKKEKKGKKNA